MTRNDQEGHGRTCVLNIAKIVETKNIVRCTSTMLAQNNDGGVQEKLPNQVTAIGHSSDRTNWTTSTRELECALWCCHLEAFVQ